MKEVKDKFAPTLIAGYKLWPAAHLINFALVPPNQRILYANVVSVSGGPAAAILNLSVFGEECGLDLVVSCLLK